VLGSNSYKFGSQLKATLCSSDVFVKQRPLEPLWCTCTVVNNRNSPVTAYSTELLMMVIG